MTMNKWSWSGQKCTEIENAAFQHQTKKKKDKTSSTTIRVKDEIVEVRVENGRKDHLIWHFVGLACNRK